MNIAYFISSHGFGHAARACAVIDRLIINGHHIFIYTNTPKWFFTNSLPDDHFVYNQWATDVGLIQKNPFEEDITQTIQSIQSIFPPEEMNFQKLVKQLKEQQIELVFSDISPLGILAAEAIGCDSILIENFTWDWIYEAYLPKNPDLKNWIQYFSDIFSRATHHLVTKPYCKLQTAYLPIEPISRIPRNSREIIREKLNVQPDEKMVLITMGGVPIDFQDEMLSKAPSNLKIIFPVGNLTEEKIYKNYHLLPHNHRYFHPDLVQAADLIIAKVGYSTLSEAYHADTPILYIPRPTFPESQELEKFIHRSMVGKEISETDLSSGGWINKAVKIMEQQASVVKNKINGANQVLAFFLEKYA
jgi:uncharacterized protein (TIGR00661 family)